MNTLADLKQELEEDDNIVSFALFYDRKNKKFLAVHHGDDSIIDKMLTHVVTTNPYFASAIRKVSELFKTKIPKPAFGKTDFFDIFDRFKH